MRRLGLRQKPRICYYEPDELDFDEYIFCDPCGDYVYEYCSLHGPLLVIPDDEVPVNLYLPRAMLTIPRVFLHLAPSTIPGAGLGVFTTLTLPSGVRFGPYRGKIKNEITSKYCWQIYDQNRRPSHVVDAADDDDSNWMRYVNCSRNCFEQNLVAFQYQGQIYYRTIKIIPRCSELLVFYGAEFASSLQIDLKNYNSPVGHAQKGVPLGEEDINTYCEDSEKENAPDGNRHEEHKDPSTTSCYNYDSKIKEPFTDQEIATKIDSKKNIVICDKCNEQFDSKHSLIQHLHTHLNPKEYFTCNICKFESSNVETFITHLRNNHSEPRILSDAQKPNTTIFVLMKNIENLQENENLPSMSGNRPSNVLQSNDRLYTDNPWCSICKRGFQENFDLERHLQRHSRNIRFPCSLCDKSYFNKDSLRRHRKQHRSEEKPSFNVYESGFCESSKKYAKDDTEKDKNKSCPICNKVFISNYNVRRHFKTQH